MLNLSVLITCKDKEPYLDECVSSVLRQTKEPKEIIIVHDECREPMHHAEATTIMLKTNLGVARARHEAFRYSTGELVLFLDGDDIISPDYLEKMVLALVDTPRADVACPDIYFFGDSGKSLNITPKTIDPRLITRLGGKLPIPVSCVIKREIYEKVGGFGNWEVMEDFDFWLKVMCNGYIFKKAQTLLWYRQEGQKRNAMELSKKKKIIAEILAQYTIKDDAIKKNG